jgi:hypothetical protein
MSMSTLSRFLEKRKAHMLQTVATVPVPQMIELLALMDIASDADVEPRLLDYLHNCRRIGYEPPEALLRLARENIRGKRLC